MSAGLWRVGHGYDVHRLEPGTGMRLGGVAVACDFGIVAHSDGDVLLHAICDALLGAAGLGDIGEHFPDTDAQYAGADSAELTRHVVDLLGQRGWYVGNLDCTLVAQVPRVEPVKAQIRSRVAALLQVSDEQVNFKATTTERLGPVGRKEGIAAHAVALIYHGQR